MTMMSVLSVPLMIGVGTPTMLTVDMAFRVNSYGDYAVANALGGVAGDLRRAVVVLPAPQPAAKRRGIMKALTSPHPRHGG